jgi:NAD+ diphosphatase
MPDPLPADLGCGTPVYLGTCDDLFFYAAEVATGVTPPRGSQLSPVRELSGKVPDSDMAVASYAVRILDFDRSTAFCGRCGRKTRPLTTERARICTACNRIFYPRISPAIIVLVKKERSAGLFLCPLGSSGHRRLATRENSSRLSTEKSARSALRRETPLLRASPTVSDSLMICTRLAGGDIRIDNQEIEAAGWFNRTRSPFPRRRASRGR